MGMFWKGNKIGLLDQYQGVLKHPQTLGSVFFHTTCPRMHTHFTIKNGTSRKCMDLQSCSFFNDGFS